MGQSESILKLGVRLALLGLALLPAALFLLVKFLDTQQQVHVDAQVQAYQVNEFIKLNAESWSFLHERLSDQIGFIRHEQTQTQVEDKTGRVLHQWGAPCTDFCLSAKAPLLDYGVVVGQLKVSAALSRPLQLSALIFAVGALLVWALQRVLEKQVLQPFFRVRAANQTLQDFDNITHLHSRSYVVKHLQSWLQEAQSSQRVGALLTIDIDQFKVINDSLGHDWGDQLLNEVAERLRTSTREGDLLGRLGGDEFVLAMNDLGIDPMYASQRAQRIAEAIRRKLALPYVLPGQSKVLNLTVSIGVTLISSATGAAADLLRQAEIALYEAKNLGRNSVRLFTADAQRAADSRMQLEAAMRAGLENREFVAFYQAQCDADGKVVGAEALLRWDSPERGLVAPAGFIAVAEETGLIFPLGDQVIRMACEQLKAWENTPWQGIPISVNVSVRQFEQEDFEDRIKATLAVLEVNPALLKLEITESVVINNLDQVVAQMRSLAEFGIAFALDDFGTGHSSLHLIKALPLQQIKIDKSFVGQLTSDANDYAIVKTIIALGQSLDLEVVAEGVETDEQRMILLSLGCTRFQGYLFGKPKPASQWV